MKVKFRDVEALQEMLIRKGMSKRQFGKLIGIGQTYTVQICNGSRSPSPAVAKKISEVLETEWDEIFIIERSSAKDEHEVCV